MSYVNEFDKFQTAGEYYVDISVGDKTHRANFSVENAGTIRKLFTFLFYAPIYNLFLFLAYITNYSLGWAIICVTILIRIGLIWPQHKMMIAQRRLQAIQPKIKAIHEKYKGKQQELCVKLLELYKKE